MHGVCLLSWILPRTTVVHLRFQFGQSPPLTHEPCFSLVTRRVTGLVLPRLGLRDRSASTMACLPLHSQKFLADVYVLWHVYKNLSFIFPQVTFGVPIICGEL
jgi:hypothetical protein